jgi:hypothetical protein
LTPRGTTTTMRRMSKDVLLQMLPRVPGLSGKGGVYESKAGHQVTMYIGSPGRAMAVSDVTRIEVREAHVEVTSKSRGTLFCPADEAFSVADNAETEGRSKRAGFGLD